MDFEAARGIADAVFYEGYLLYPYTATSHKNKLRWQFGIVVPQAHEAARTGEHGHQQTDVLFESGLDAQIDILFRFLQVEARTVEVPAADRRDGDFMPVPSLHVDGVQHVTFDESIEREVVTSFRPSAGAPIEIRLDFGGNRQVEDICNGAGTIVGRVVRERWPLSGKLSVSAVPSADARISRLRVRVENASAIVTAPERGVVLRTAFVSAHTLLGIAGGAFFSPVDPPDASLARALPLKNEHTWPVLVGDAQIDPQRAAIVLSSPIVLADFPGLAKQTSADAFDGTEIDELLMLSVQSLSDAERNEARMTDPRARAIIERAEAFGAADLERTHATCEMPAGKFPIFGAEGSIEAATAPRSVEVAGTAVMKGSSVRLAPKRRADAWDMFLAGKIATVQAIHQDFEDKIYVAVTVDDDPATEYHQWYGRSFFFDPDEVEPITAPA